MKAKLRAKKIISILLAMLMLFSVVSVSAYAEDTEPCVEHDPSEWTEIKQHTCTSEGRRVIMCRKCSTILQSETVPAHDYTVIYGQEADCMRSGYRLWMCSTCEDIQQETLEIDKVKGHKFGEWQVEKEATCNAEGEMSRYCFNNTVDKDGKVTYCDTVETMPIPKNDNHKNVTWYEDEDHIFAPTCDRDGYQLGYCSDCEQEVRRKLERHTYSEFEVLSKTESTCHTHGIEYRRCLGTEVDGVFVPCGLRYEVELELNPNNHEYSQWEITKQPTCTPGQRERFCIYDYNIKDTQAIPATGEHNLGSWVIEEEPDCTHAGLRTRECLDCDYEVSETLPIKHDFTVWETVVKHSCDEDEPVQGTVLAKCDKCTEEKYFIIPAVHSFGEWTIVEKADCRKGSDGIMQRSCSYCEKVESKSYAPEHNYTEWLVTDAPVCATKDYAGRSGMYTRVCLDCGDQQQKKIPVTHEFVEGEIVTYAECKTADSGLKIESCKFCDAFREVKYSIEHNFGEWQVAVAPTCNSVGKEVRKCIVPECGYTEEKEIPAGHTYGNWYVENGKLTCTKDATASLTRMCAKCGTTETAVRSLNHPNLRTVKTEATCSTSGYTRELCPDCDYAEVVGEITPALGHDIAEHWTIKVEPTCSAAGARYKECSRCDYLVFENIARTQHTLIEIEPGREATCTERGISPKSYCGVCFEEFDHEFTPKLDHRFEEGSETCSRCYAYKDSPESGCVCACHSSMGMEKIIFEIVKKIYQMFGLKQVCKCGVLHYDEPGIFATLFGGITIE